MKRDRENDTDPGLGPPAATRGDTLVDLPRRRQEMRYGTDPGIPVSDSDRDLLRNLVSADRRRSNEAPNRLFESVLDSLEAPADTARTPVPTPISVAGPRTQIRFFERSAKWLVAVVGGLVVVMVVALVLRESGSAQSRTTPLSAKSVFLGSRQPPPDRTALVVSTAANVPPIATASSPTRPAPSPPPSASIAAPSRPIVKGSPTAPEPEPSVKPRLEGLRHP